MKDGDRIVSQCRIMVETRPYFPSDKIARRVRGCDNPDSHYHDDPKIMFPKVYYTTELKLYEN